MALLGERHAQAVHVRRDFGTVGAKRGRQRLRRRGIVQAPLQQPSRRLPALFGVALEPRQRLPAARPLDQIRSLQGNEDRPVGQRRVGDPGFAGQHRWGLEAVRANRLILLATLVR